MKRLLALTLACLMFLCLSVLADGPIYPGDHHTTSHGGAYPGGSGSSHKGGLYVNPKTGNQYGHHKK